MAEATELNTLEEQILNAKKLIENSDKLKQLEENTLYIELIKELYLKEYALAAIQCKTEPTKQHDLLQKDIENSLIGISAYQQWVRETHLAANEARERLVEQENTHNELLQETE